MSTECGPSARVTPKDGRPGASAQRRPDPTRGPQQFRPLQHRQGTATILLSWKHRPTSVRVRPKPARTRPDLGHVGRVWPKVDPTWPPGSGCNLAMLVDLARIRACAGPDCTEPGRFRPAGDLRPNGARLQSRLLEPPPTSSLRLGRYTWEAAFGPNSAEFALAFGPCVWPSGGRISAQSRAESLAPKPPRGDVGGPPRPDRGRLAWRVAAARRRRHPRLCRGVAAPRRPGTRRDIGEPRRGTARKRRASGAPALHVRRPSGVGAREWRANGGRAGIARAARERRACRATP